MRERPVRDLKMRLEKLVELLHWGVADVKHEELLRSGGLEVRSGLGMMLVPILEPSLLKLVAVANALRRQGF